ncbi:MAG TPA: hypothetical protein VFZ03_01300, partial [Dongiaceae bacterium]
MITAFVFRGGSLIKSTHSGAEHLATDEAPPAAGSLPGHAQAVTELAAETLPREAVWVDLLNPSHGEIASVERAYAMEVPTREEMR